VRSLRSIVFLGKLLVAKKLWVHASQIHKLGTLRLLDAIGMRLLRVVVRTCVLLLYVT
jgi:hypothetical protein